MYESVTSQRNRARSERRWARGESGGSFAGIQAGLPADSSQPKCFRWLRGVFSVAILLPLSAIAVDFPEPPRSTLASVSPSTTVFGMEMSIRRFNSDLTPSEVLGFYSELWGDDAVGSSLPPWEMIGTRSGKRYLNVQVQPQGGGSWGYLSSSDLPGRIEKGDSGGPKGQDFPKMAGSRVLNDQHHNDPMKTGRVVLLTNDFSVKANGDFYRRHYEERGWVVQNDSASSKLKGRVLVISRGRSLLTVTVNKLEGRTMIVANLEKAGLLR